MVNRRRVIYSLVIGILVCVLFGGLIAGFSGRGQSQGNQQRQTATILRRGGPSTDQPPTPKELDDAATPIVDFTRDSSTVTEDRRQKNRRYDGHGVVKNDIDPQVASVVRDSETPISDVPTDNSDLVIEGRVTDAEAFLSNDKRDVYSEFTLHVTDILKASPSSEVHRGDSVIADRWGGRVRFPNGRIIRYSFVGQGSPMKGNKYLLFLSRTGQGSYKIITGYEIGGNRVSALDGARVNNRGMGKWPFDKHNGEEYEKLRKTVEDSILNDRKGGRQ